jgi:formylglycine-generating enzyme required for sulfatase activity
LTGLWAGCWLCAWVLAFVPSAVRAEYRHALVIGNSAYPANAASAPLASPAHDARLVGDSLEKRGFVVTRVENAGANLRAVLTEFGRSIPNRGTALVYFAGYAVPVTQPGNPKFIPDNALLRLDGQADVTVRQALTLMSGGGSAIQILVVDGCYPRPGLKTPQAVIATGSVSPDSLVIYPAEFGQTLEPPVDGVSKLARRFADELASSKPLDEILANLGAAREWSLGDHAHQGPYRPEFPVEWPTAPKRSLVEHLSFLKSPASAPPVSPPTTLAPGTKPGEEWVSPSGMVFCWCPPGKTRIGSDPKSAGHQPDETLVDVEIPAGFWLSKYEFTRRDVFELNKGHVYLSTGTHKLQPVNFLHDDPLPRRPWKPSDGGSTAASFVGRHNLTAPAGWTYDLPTEAEWEYAARAGTLTAYSFGDDPSLLARHGNFADRSLRESTALPEKSSGNPQRGTTGTSVQVFRDEQSGLYAHAHKVWDDGNPVIALVGSYPPNPWGLHDMHGNVSELTSTIYHPARETVPADSTDPLLRQVTKGGNWQSYPEYCRSAFRSRKISDGENIDGFRLILRPTANAPASAR